MITKNINFKNFVIKIKKFQISKKLRLLLNQNNPILTTLSPEYKYSYNNRIISKFKKSSSFIRKVDRNIEIPIPIAKNLYDLKS